MFRVSAISMAIACSAVVTFAGGQDQLKGKIIRLSHLGYVGAFDVIIGLSALVLALTHFGAKVNLGAGVGAAEKILGEGLPARG
jgi:aspartate aminotransferase-like enzyme